MRATIAATLALAMRLSPSKFPHPSRPIREADILLETDGLSV